MASSAYDPESFWDERHQLGGYSELQDDWLYRFNRSFKLAVVRWALSRIGADFRGLSALDIGCGTGDITGVLLEKGCNVTAIDISSVAIDKARERFKDKKDRVNFLLARVEDLPFPSGSFDLVTSVAVLQHIVDDKAFFTAASRLADVLKVGGFLLAVERAPRKANTTQTLAHVADRTRQQWIETLRRHNLRLVYERGYPLQAFAPIRLWIRTSNFLMKVLRPRHFRRTGTLPPQGEGKGSRPSGPAHWVYRLGERAALAAVYVLDHWFFFTVRRHALRRAMVFRKKGSASLPSNR